MSISLFSVMWLQVAINQSTISHCQKESPKPDLLFASEDAVFVGTCNVSCVLLDTKRQSAKRFILLILMPPLVLSFMMNMDISAHTGKIIQYYIMRLLCHSINHQL